MAKLRRSKRLMNAKTDNEDVVSTNIKKRKILSKSRILPRNTDKAFKINAPSRKNFKIDINEHKDEVVEAKDKQENI